MSDFKTRLREEKDELNKKYIKLDAFIGTEDFLKLPDEQQFLLVQQRLLMIGYFNVLDRRIELIED